MPTYEYQCTKCERVFEVFHSITAKPKRRIPTDCRQCKNSAPVRRLIGSGSGVIFKGSGFYQTDYRSEGYKKAEKAEKEAAKTATDGGSKDGTKSDTAKKGDKAAKPSGKGKKPAKRNSD